MTIKNVEDALKIRKKLIVLVPKYDKIAKSLGEPTYINTIGDNKWSILAETELSNKKEIQKEKDWFSSQMVVAKSAKESGINLQQKMIKARNKVHLRNNNIIRQYNKKNGTRISNQYGRIPIFGSLDTMVRGSTLPAEGNGTGLSAVNLKNLKNVIGHRESKNNYQAINTLGFLGKYQFGKAALEDLGLLRKGASKRGKNKVVLENDQNWKTDYSKKRFLNDTELQEQTMDNWMNLIVKRLPSSIKSKGQGHIAGMIMMAHLGGVGTAKKFLRTGADFKDAYGTSILEYYNLGAASTIAGDSQNTGSQSSNMSQSRNGGNSGTSSSSGIGAWGRGSKSWSTTNNDTISASGSVSDFASQFLGKGYSQYNRGVSRDGNSVLTNSNSYDCSSFVGMIMQEKYGISYSKFGKTTEPQFRFCRANFNQIQKSKIEEGDVIFYDHSGPGYVSHVAIAVSNSEMIHARGIKHGIQKTKIGSKNFVGAFRPAEGGKNKEVQNGSGQTPAYISAAVKQFVPPNAVQSGANPLKGLTGNFFTMASLSKQMRGLTTQVHSPQININTESPGKEAIPKLSSLAVLV